MRVMQNDQGLLGVILMELGIEQGCGSIRVCALLRGVAAAQHLVNLEGASQRPEPGLAARRPSTYQRRRKMNVVTSPNMFLSKF
jgi:hypothetical protein